MLDPQLIESIANLDSIEKLIESKSKEYLDPDKILTMLSVDFRDLNVLMDQQSKQAAQCLFYNFLAAKFNSICYLYEETIYNPYMAHCRIYASYYLAAMDRRDTIESLKDAVSIIFSKNNTNEMKLEYAEGCYHQSLKPVGSKKEFKVDTSDPSYSSNLARFYQMMYSIDNGYEDFVEQKSKYDDRKRFAEALVESFKTLSINTSNITKLRLSGSSEAARIDSKTIAKLRSLMSSNPGLTDDYLAREVNNVIS